MYQALYRKYRPQTFDDVIGQKHITDSLKKQVETGHLSHAYIFIGTRGTGKTTCARILAKAVNCENPQNGNPCCECAACRGISDGSIMDIVELDAASNNGVDNVRALREEAVFSPANAKKRIYIIDEVHMLSTSAFNALLKILEEPPEHLIFILATTELQKVPATILSRCQRHSFKRIENKELSDYLVSIAEKEKLSLSQDAASLLAGLAEGSVRDALSMLDQCATYEKIGVDEVYEAVGLAGNKRITALFQKILNKNTDEVLEDFNSLWKDGKDAATILKEVSGICRDTLIYKMAPRNAAKLIYGGYQIDDIKAVAETCSADDLIRVLKEIEKTTDGMKDRLNPQVSAEICLVRLCLGENAVLTEGKVMASVQPSAPQSEQKREERKSVQDTVPENTVTGKDEEPAGDVSKPEEPVSINQPEEPKTAPASGNEWETIRNTVKPVLPFDIQTALPGISGRINGGILELFVNSDFLLGRISRPDIVTVIENKAAEVLGRQVKLKITQGDADAKPSGRSLDELKAFGEITWR